jgi:hypothetical protein
VSSAAPTPASVKAEAPAGKQTLVTSSETSQTINLRDPWLAAFLAWLVPGLGHMYQRRWGKGGLFMTCILGTFFYGLWLGGGRVVYASFRDSDPQHNIITRDRQQLSFGTRTGLFTSQARYAYFCQFCDGLPALPAIVQSLRVGGDTPKAPLFDGFMAPPMVRGQIVPEDWILEQRAKHPDDKTYDQGNYRTLEDTPYTIFQPINFSDRTDQLGYWNYQLGSFFDLGTVFTMIAGLLNVLAIWDAWGGPAVPATKSEKDEKKSKPVNKTKPKS